MTIPNFRFKFYVGSVFLIALICGIAYLMESLTPLWAFVVVGPVILVGLMDILQKKQAIRRNYPIIGRLRYVMETLYISEDLKISLFFYFGFFERLRLAFLTKPL